MSVTNGSGASAPNKLFTYVAPGAITFTQILGQPTDTNATVNVHSSASIDMYYQYGTTSGNYTATTPMVTTNRGSLHARRLDRAIGDRRTDISIRSITTGFNIARQVPPPRLHPGTERSFHTQRKPGSSFVFTVQGDSHPERVGTMFHSDLYNQTLQGVAAVQADFHITNGDDFSVQNVQNPYTQPAGRGALHAAVAVLGSAHQRGSVPRNRQPRTDIAL